MSRDSSLFLIDMRDACARIVHHCGRMPREVFFANDLARDAVLWNLLVLGEAAKQVPETIRVANPTIEWRKITGFRDVLAHGYFGIDEDILWDVIDTKIPPFSRPSKKRSPRSVEHFSRHPRYRIPGVPDRKPR